MGNITKRDTVLKILAEYKLGKNISEIARITGTSRTTVHRYLNVYIEKFPPVIPTLSEEELRELNEQALEVLETLYFEDRDQSGRKKTG